MPKVGKCGNHDGRAHQALDALTAAGIGLEEIVDLVTRAVDAPSLDTADEREVHRWVEQATKQMVDRYRARRLRRAVLDLLDAQHQLSYQAAEHARRVGKAAEVAAGTYWRQRDGCRTSTRAIHVDIDPAAWAAMKLDVLHRGSTLGEAVGELVRSEVQRRRQTLGQVRDHTTGGWSGSRAPAGEGRRAKVFARIAVDADTWVTFRALAQQGQITVARAVGLLVELR